MITETLEIHKILIDIFKHHVPPLKITIDTHDKLEVTGTKEAMQGKKKVDGLYFGSIVPKPKDVRLYFFPTYTHAEEFQDISEALRKCLKGKSCFHIKKIDDDLEKDIRTMVNKGIAIYKREKYI